MNKRLIYTNQKGNLSVVIPSPNFDGTIEELRDQLVSRGDLNAVDEIDIIEQDEIPNNRIFRNAWKKPKKGFTSIDIDLPKAKDIAHSLRRKKRSDELKPLDQEVNINVANPAKINEIESKRQSLRNKYDIIQNNIDACDNVAALEVIVISEELVR